MGGLTEEGTMKGADGKEAEAASVIKVAREPAIIINGVPDLPPDRTGSEPEVKNDAESQVDPRFGEWLEGRKVRKLFGDTYYVGKVAKYDSESNWYNIIYNDGDQEDLEWSELEAVLLPLDITVPLRTLGIDKFKNQGLVPNYSKPKVGRPKKVYGTMDGNTKGKTNTGVEGQGQQSDDATSGQLVTVTAGGNAEACLQASDQPRKRGRPKKDASLSANDPPKKRGRPPKNRNAQIAENTPDSLAQNSTFMRNTMTVRAEKLKRESLRVQGTPSGT
ncbi:unnamed protein product [Urochloa humidicola]